MAERDRLIHNIRAWQHMLEEQKQALQGTMDGLQKAMDELTQFMEAPMIERDTRMEPLTYGRFRIEQDDLGKQVNDIVTPFCRKYNLIPQELTFSWNYHGECRVKVSA